MGGSPGKKTGVGCQALLPGIFRAQGSNACPRVSSTAGGFLITAPLGSAAAGTDTLSVCSGFPPNTINLKEMPAGTRKKRDGLHTIRAHSAVFIPAFPNVYQVATRATYPWKDGGDTDALV